MTRKQVVRVGLVLALLCLLEASLVLGSIEQVSFVTADGKTIYGTVQLPDGAVGQLPAVLLLHSEQHDQNLFRYLSEFLIEEEIAALRIDRRGRGLSVGHGEFHELAREDLENQHLDTRAAIDFLARHPRVDSRRIAVLGELDGGDVGVQGAQGDHRVQAFVFLSPRLSAGSRHYLLEKSEEIPMYFLSSSADRISFQDVGEVYGFTENRASKLTVYNKGGFGTTMLRYTESLSGEVVQWLVAQLKSLPRQREVHFKSQDGWTLKGVFYDPGNRHKGTPVPGVILVHGSNHDSFAYHRLAPMLAKSGLATLRFDWRGRGRSRGEGNADPSLAHLDIQAALDYIAAQEAVDPDRLGIVAATRGSFEALVAAENDSRVRAMTVLTAYLVDQASRDLITRFTIPFLFVASRDDVNYLRGNLGEGTADAYSRAQNRESQLILYEASGRGTGIFDQEPSLEPTVAEWMAEQLSLEE